MTFSIQRWHGGPTVSHLVKLVVYLVQRKPTISSNFARCPPSEEKSLSHSTYPPVATHLVCNGVTHDLPQVAHMKMGVYNLPTYTYYAFLFVILKTSKYPTEPCHLSWQPVLPSCPGKLLFLLPRLDSYFVILQER